LCHVASAGSGNSGRIVPATAIPPFVVIASPLLLDQDRSRIAAHRRVDEREPVVLADEVAVDEAEALEPDEPRTVLGCLHAWAE
jgi:hypothetical protein